MKSELAAAQQEIASLATSLAHAQARLKVALDSTDEGLLMVDQEGKVLSTNKRFIELWRVPSELAGTGDDDLLLAHVLDQLVDPAQFLAKVKQLYGSEAEARDTLHFKDGRVFARYTRSFHENFGRGRIWCFKDITEQFHAQTALAEREERFRTVFESSPDSAWIMDGHRFVECNQAAAITFGFSDRAAFMNVHPSEISPPSQTDGESSFDKAERMMALADRHGLNRFEWIHKRADGSEFFAEVTLASIQLKNRRGIYAVVRNITQRVVAEYALHKENEKNLALLRNASDGIHILDTGGKLIEASDAFCTMLGYSREELLGKDVFQWDAGHSPEELAQLLKQQLDSPSRMQFETRHRRKDGSTFDVEVSGLPLMLGGKPAIFNSSRDITERKRLALRANLAFEVTKVLSWELDFRTGVFTYDQSTLPRLGLEPDQALGNLPGWIARAHPDDRVPLQENIAAAIALEGSVFDFEYRMSNQAGQYQWIQTTGRMVERADDGSPVIAVGTSININTRKIAEQKLRDSEERYRNLASMLRLMCDNVPDMIWAKDMEQRYLFANKAMCAQLLNAVDTSEPVGKTDLFFAQRERLAHHSTTEWHTFGELCQDTDRITLEKNCPSVFEESGNIRGQHLVLDVHKAPFVDEFGRIIGTVGSARDVTTRKRVEEQLLLAANVFTHASEGIIIADAEGTILDVNAAFSTLTGYSREEVKGRNPRVLRSGRQNDAFYTAMWQELVEKGSWAGELWNRRKDGEEYAVSETINAVRDEHGRTKQYVALFSDITLEKEHENQLEYIAHYDALTTLPNRLLLADRMRQAMAQALRRQHPLAVVYLDLDGFKSINDQHGHDIGDRLLVTVATRMKLALREGDTFARLGGDEFVAVLPDLDDMAASIPMVTRLLAAAAQPVEIDGLVLNVSASLGITVFPQTEEVDADQLLRQADQAMYQAKLAGKNRYHLFDAEEDRSVRGHHMSIRRIRHALSEHEFVLHFQPKVNMRSGTVIGVEALIRWQHPQEGLLPPAAFLPVVEDHALGAELGEWVMHSALIEMEHWQSRGLEMPVSVNVSAFHLQRPNFVDRLGEILASHPSVNPRNLSLEILETSALEDVIKISHVIEACRDLGVMFALDDFGTGYASLTYLKRLPVAEIKIDQSFIHDMLSNPDDLTIIKCVLTLAEAFERKIIAEGVETAQQAAMLLDLGCERAQGAGIARPMPAGEILEWSTAWPKHPVWKELRGDCTISG